jgi:hypothetical protein
MVWGHTTLNYVKAIFTEALILHNSYFLVTMSPKSAFLWE